MTRLTSSNPESKYILEENALDLYNKAARGRPVLRTEVQNAGKGFVNRAKHGNFTDGSINVKIFHKMSAAEDFTCTLNELQTSIGGTADIPGYLRELNKMGILRMVSE